MVIVSVHNHQIPVQREGFETARFEVAALL